MFLAISVLDEPGVNSTKATADGQAAVQGINQMDSIIVHGPALEAYTAIGHLQAAGVDLAKVKHLAPARQQPGPAGLYLEGLSVLLQEAAGLAGVALLAATQVSSAPLCVSHNSRKLQASG